MAFPSSNPISSCGIFKNILRIDSYDNEKSSITRIFNKLPPHFQKLVSFRLLKIDYWKGQFFEVYLNTTKVFFTSINDNDLTFGERCGSNGPEATILVSFSISSIEEAIEIVMKSTEDSNCFSQSWGFNDFFLAVSLCDSSCRTCYAGTNTSCLSCYQNATLSKGSCICNVGFYPTNMNNSCGTSSCPIFCYPCPVSCSGCSNELVCSGCKIGNK